MIQLEAGEDFVALEDLTGDMIEDLRDSMKGDEERAKELDAQSEKEIMFRSMTALEAIQATSNERSVRVRNGIRCRGTRIN